MKVNHWIKIPTNTKHQKAKKLLITSDYNRNDATTTKEKFMTTKTKWACTITLATLTQLTVMADTVLYNAAPASYPSVRSGLMQEFGTANFPPLAETALSYYQVQGSGPVNLTFRFHADTGSFVFNFGYYRYTAALGSIDTSTTAGKIAYATQALAPGNATLVFNDVVDNPGAVRTIAATGGDTLGFFLIPDATLAQFQNTPGSFGVEGIGSATFGYPGLNRWPLFGLPGANPGGMDQLMSFSGISGITGRASSLFAWEDLTRATITGNPQQSDNAFNDLIFAVEGVQAVPEPSSWSLLCMSILGLGGAVGIRRKVQNSTT